MNIQDIKINKIKKSIYQTRLQDIKEDLEIPELINSIKQLGLLNPITVQKVKDNYIVIAGHRRLEAYKKLNKNTIAANIITLDKLNKDISKELRINIAENIIREDLTPVEIGIAIHQLKILDKLKIYELTNIIHKSERYIKQHLALVNLHQDIKQDIINHHTKTDKKILEKLARIPEQHKQEQKDIYFQLKDEIIDNYEANYLIDKIQEQYNEIPENSEKPIFQWNKNTFSINNLNIAEDKKEQMQNDILEIIKKYEKQ